MMERNGMENDDSSRTLMLLSIFFFACWVLDTVIILDT
jgi:hypothetical protein